MLISNPLSANIAVIMFVITPSFLTLAGGVIQIGVVKPSVAISISLSVPAGIVLLLKVIFSKLTTSFHRNLKRIKLLFRG
jgi:hypothetical protein